MISVTTALAFDRLQDTAPQPDGGKQLTDEQQVELEYVDSIIEGALYNYFVGKMLAIPVPVQYAPILDTLRVRYEEGGWSVGAFPQLDGDVVREILLVIAPGSTVAPVEKPKNDALPPIQLLLAVPVAVPSQKRLLVRMPTRGRPAQALRVLEQYRELAGMPITIEVVIDEDDETMLASRVLQRLNALDCVITVGPHKSKVEAVNGGRVMGWDVLLLASDDMLPVQAGYAVEVMRAMEEHWPHLDGAVFFDDGYAHDRCVTLPVMGRRLWEQFGYVYDPSYKSLCVDVEQTEVLIAMGKLRYVDKCIIEHRHPAARKAPKDALYERNDALHGADRETYERRKVTRRLHAQWSFDSPPLWLSVLICSTPKRKQQLERLLDHLWNQTLHSRCVEILIDSGEGTIGEKRQRLLERARACYVVYVDDDDWVAHDFIIKIVDAVSDNPGVDCISLRGVYTINGERPKVFEHSLANKIWDNDGEILKRPPNHLNPVKRELSLQAGFPPLQQGEDKAYSDRLLPLLKTEAALDGIQYHYFYIVPGTVGGK